MTEFQSEKYCKNIHFLSLLNRSGSNWWWLENRRETSTLLNHQIYWLELFMPFFPGICGVHRVRQCGQLLWCPAVLCVCWSENCYKIFLSLAVLTRNFLLSFIWFYFINIQFHLIIVNVKTIRKWHTTMSNRVEQGAAREILWWNHGYSTNVTGFSLLTIIFTQ